MSGATIIFIPIAVLTLAFAVVAVGRLVSGIADAPAQAVEADARMLALESAKQRVFAQLKDLEHEYALGKLSDEDYEGLKRHFEGEAVRILEEIEAA